MAASLPELLCVDDEPRVLEGLSLTLRKHFRVTTAPGGAEALTLLKGRPGAFAVIVSDMRMPGMDGAALLAAARAAAPDTVRILLTGFADMSAAVSAVNEGQIFRFLTKPCPTDQLISCLQNATEQHRLIVSERELLEKTLHGSIKALIDILAASSPRAFGRATRLKSAAGRVGKAMGVKDVWALEIAASLSQIGYVILPPKTIDKLFSRQPLDPDETNMLEKVPGIARQIVREIPRLENVAEILDHHTRSFVGRAGETPTGEAIPLGARILRVVQDYDALEDRGTDKRDILKTLAGRTGVYDPKILAAIGALSNWSDNAVVEMKMAALVPGMILAADVVTTTGTLLLARGQEISESSLERLRNFVRSAGVKEPVHVFDDSVQRVAALAQR